MFSIWIRGPQSHVTIKDCNLQVLNVYYRYFTLKTEVKHWCNTDQKTIWCRLTRSSFLEKDFCYKKNWNFFKRMQDWLNCPVTSPKDISNILQDFRQVVNQCTYVQCNKVSRAVVGEAHGLAVDNPGVGVCGAAKKKKKTDLLSTQRSNKVAIRKIITYLALFHHKVRNFHLC